MMIDEDGTRTCFVRMLTSCPNCGNEEMMVKIVAKPNTNGLIMVFACCPDCGWSSGGIAHEDNLQKRTNTKLNNLAKDCKRRDHMRCVICGSTQNLHAHHIIPVDHSEDYKYVLSNMITLCSNCHKLVHHKDKSKEVIK